MTKYLIIVYSACPGLHSLAPKQAVVSQDTCQWQLLPNIKTKKETAKLARVTQEISVPRNTPEGSFSSQIHLTSTPHTPWRAGSKQQEDQDHHWLSSYTSPQDCSASEQVSCIRTQSPHSAVCQQYCMVQDYLQSGVLPSAEKVLCKLPTGAAIFDPNCLYTRNREKNPPC